MVHAKEVVNKDLVTTLNKLITVKSTIMRKLDERIEKAVKQKLEVNAQAERVITDSNTKTDLLASIREAVCQSDNIQDVSETFKEMKTH